MFMWLMMKMSFTPPGVRLVSYFEQGEVLFNSTTETRRSGADIKRAGLHLQEQKYPCNAVSLNLYHFWDRMSIQMWKNLNIKPVDMSCFFKQLYGVLVC